MASAGDPVRSGLGASLARRPGGNVTGMTVLGPELGGQTAGLLKQAMPKISRVAVLWNPANPAIRYYYEETQKAAALLQVTLEPVVEIRGIDDVDRAFATTTKGRPDAIVVLADGFLLAHRHRIVEFAVGKRLPGMCAYRGYADDVGGSWRTPRATSSCSGAPRNTWTRSSRGRSLRTPRPGAELVRAAGRSA